MKYYMAPLEGITGYIYRNAHSAYFEKFDKYFTPFLAPHGEKEKLTHRERNDIAPEHNQGLYVVPQILTNKVGDFIRVAGMLKDLGYEEVNLNLGCPSGTVVSKYKGAGFLAKPQELEAFLTEIFEALDMRISVKTRIGMYGIEEFEQILDIFERFPLEELVIHPRLRQEFYSGTPHREVFHQAAEQSRHKLCYNGDISLAEHIAGLRKEEPQVERLMIGRGILRNPGFLDLARKGQMPEKSVLKEFHDRLYGDYRDIMPGERPTLFKMKELWFYMGTLFTGWEECHAKQIRKVNSLRDYEQIVKQIFRDEVYVQEV
ncbi:MAG: tRNA-dihydrouridine synthase family protein [Lachnospiraceae bacterium]|nr:tRNA-dihydrouridine synthase family protein [Lachnospiraceae bacterium]